MRSSVSFLPFEAGEEDAVLWLVKCAPYVLAGQPVGIDLFSVGAAPAEGTANTEEGGKCALGFQFVFRGPEPRDGLSPHR